MNPIDKILGSVRFKNSNIAGAGLPLQRQWNMLPKSQKVVNKIIYHDSDRDGVPNKWDCRPLNPLQQDAVKLHKARQMLKRTNLYHNEYKSKSGNINLFVSSPSHEQSQKYYSPEYKQMQQLADYRNKRSDALFNKEFTSTTFKFRPQGLMPGQNVKVEGTKHKYTTVVDVKPNVLPQPQVQKRTTEILFEYPQPVPIPENKVLVEKPSGKYKYYPTKKLTPTETGKHILTRDTDFEKTDELKYPNRITQGTDIVYTNPQTGRREYGKYVKATDSTLYVAPEGEYQVQKLEYDPDEDLIQESKLARQDFTPQYPASYTNKEEYKTINVGQKGHFEYKNSSTRNPIQITKIETYKDMPRKGYYHIDIEKEKSWPSTDDYLPIKDNEKIDLNNTTFIFSGGDWSQPLEKTEKGNEQGKIVSYQKTPYVVHGAYKHFSRGNVLAAKPLLDENGRVNLINEYSLDAPKRKEETYQKPVPIKVFNIGERIADTGGRYGTISDIQPNGLYVVLWDNGEFTSGWEGSQLLPAILFMEKKQPLSNISLANVDEYGNVNVDLNDTEDQGKSRRIKIRSW